MTPADFPLTFPLLRPNYARGLEQALKDIERYEAEGVLLKVELEGVKYAVSNAIDEAWNKTVRERYTYSGKWESLTEDERKLEQSLGHPYAHTIGGYLKKAQAATKADGPMRTDMIAIAGELAPLGARVVALKAIIGKRAPKPTKTSIARDERDAKAMTCQCCARKILAETGQIAHHGYERPQGWGYQTASCEGALRLPFEVSRDALGKMIERLRDYAANQKSFCGRVQLETVDIPFRYTDVSKLVNRWDRGEARTTPVNRANFDAKMAEIAPLRNPLSSTPTFENLKAATLGEINREITMVEHEITAQQARYDGWTQTHQRQGDAWTSLAGEG